MSAVYLPTDDNSAGAADVDGAAAHGENLVPTADSNRRPTTGRLRRRSQPPTPVDAHHSPFGPWPPRLRVVQRIGLRPHIGAHTWRRARGRAEAALTFTPSPSYGP